MKIAKLFSIFVLSLPLWVYADQVDNLLVSNSTKSNLSFSVNNVCSKDLGVISSDSIQSISYAAIRNACAGHLSQCQTVLYQGEHCDGAPISYVIFYDLNTDDPRIGIGGMKPPQGYSTGMTGNKYLFVTGPWM